MITDPPSTNHGLSAPQLKLLNTFAFIATLALNGISSSGVISSQGVGEISRKYPTKITPAGGAFGIWGIIYMVECFFIGYQFFWPRNPKAESTFLHDVGLWYASACACNSLWICTWVQGSDSTTVVANILIAGLLFSLCKIYVNTNCWGTTRSGGVLMAVALDVHISMYAGWVTVATIVATTISLTTVWDADDSTQTTCAVVMLIVALLLVSFIVVTRRDCVWGWVLCWASYFIAVANNGSEAADRDDAAIYTTALVVSGCIGLLSLGVGVHTVMKKRESVSGGLPMEIK